ncbi:MAG TPA: hypothetical protein VMS95_02100 [Candidatus Krumholzibacteriaceae bacterium]|nr:hypothetical protein [Candidatus Krumholzibacteriaceae bacterium]
MKENIAKVKVNLENGQIHDIRLYEKNLRFKCKRCAVYCCKLGSPDLSKEDMEQINLLDIKQANSLTMQKHYVQ